MKLVLCQKPLLYAVLPQLQGASEVGGLTRIWEIGDEGGRLDLIKYVPILELTDASGPYKEKIILKVKQKYAGYIDPETSVQMLK